MGNSSSLRFGNKMLASLMALFRSLPADQTLWKREILRTYDLNGIQTY